MNAPVTHPARRLPAAVLAAVLAVLPTAAAAQSADFPSRPIRIVSGSAAGGPADIPARIVGERLSAVLKVPVIVENRPGGTGAVALDVVAKSPPDGHTLGVGFTAANIIHPLLNDKLPFDARKDFTAIARVTYGGNLFVVHPSVPVRTMKEFVDHVKAQPQPPSYGSWGNGSGGHLVGEYLKLLTGIDMVHVPYKSTNALATDMVGGHMLLGVLDPANTLAQVRAGRLRAVGMAGPARLRGLPDVPTLPEQGIALGNGIFIGFVGPANMPRAVVERLSTEILRILAEPEVRERLANAMGDYPSPASAAEFDRQIREEFEVWRKVIVDGRITL
jgi:tripartite-type tricarboxylate transporter receptor subunit TctC